MASKVSFTELVLMSIKTLKANKLRSSLTMLGIEIGNASVITLVGVGRGAQNLAEGQLSNLGANVLFVVPGNNDTRRRGVAFPRNLVLEDADAFEPPIQYIMISPLIYGTRSSSFTKHILITSSLSLRRIPITPCPLRPTILTSPSEKRLAIPSFDASIT